MRFLFLDRIVDLEPGRRIVTTKLVPRGEAYLAGRDGRPAVPASILMECLAQAGGFLNLVTRGYRVQTLLVLVEGLEVCRPVHAAETLTVEVRMSYAHRSGATVEGRAEVDGEVVATVDRLVLAHRWTDDPGWAESQRARVQALCGPEALAGIAGDGQR